MRNFFLYGKLLLALGCIPLSLQNTHGHSPTTKGYLLYRGGRMANPQKENGYTTIANEILGKLIELNLSGQETRAVLFVIRKTYGFNKKDDFISLTQFAKALGICKTRAAQVVKTIRERNVLTVKENINGIGIKYRFNKDWEQWKRVYKNINRIGKPKQPYRKICTEGIEKHTPQKKLLKKHKQKKYSNSDNRNTDLQEMIDYATQQGFSLQGSQKENRQYAYNLMRKKDPDGKKLGKDRVKQLIDMAIECRGEQYAPTVNDFKQLYYKFMDIMSFIEKKNKGGRIG